MRVRQYADMSITSMPRIAFAANRQIGVQALQILLEAGVSPVLLLLADGDRATFAEETLALVPGVPVLRGNVFKTVLGLQTLRDLMPDYLLSIHYPYIIPQAALDLLAVGTLNLHPALLPYNRGFHTSTWAIEEGTPYGATLHWVESGLDTGAIALQREVPVLPKDTAHTLLQRAMQAEIELFKEAVPLLLQHALPRTPQQGAGTSHAKKDLAGLQQLHPSMTPDARDRRIRALTTNDPSEAAYEEKEGVRTVIRYEE